MLLVVQGGGADAMERGGGGGAEEGEVAMCVNGVWKLRFHQMRGTLKHGTGDFGRYL